MRKTTILAHCCTCSNTDDDDFIVCPFSLRPRICRKLCSPVQPYLKQHIVHYLSYSLFVAENGADVSSVSSNVRSSFLNGVIHLDNSPPSISVNAIVISRELPKLCSNQLRELKSSFTRCSMRHVANRQSH